MNLRAITQVVLPLLQIRDVVFIAITSEETNPTGFVNKFMNAKHKDETPVFRTFHYRLICDACIAAGKEGNCKHKMGDIPYWQDQGQHRKLEAIMKDHLDDYLRETKGLNVDTNVTPAFHPQSVEFLRTPEATYIQDDHFQHVFIAIDPAAGGAKSGFAIVSAVFLKKTMIVS